MKATHFRHSSRITSLFTLLSGVSFVAPSLQAAPAAPATVPDSTIARIVSRTIGDSLGRLRDSIHAGALSPSRIDSSADFRPARNYLRTADATLFAAASGSVGDDYPLGPGDELVLSIWGQKQAQYSLVVDRDGQIQIPSAGTVNLVGSTYGDARRAIGRKLSAIYSGIGSGVTQFDLTMGKLKQIRVFVVGEVAKPGGYLLQGATSALQAVALAGGPTARGSDRLVKVSNGDSTQNVDLYQYLFLGRRPSGDVLHDGSVVRVPPALGTAQVRGGAARPGRYEVIPGETSASLLAVAGGLGPDGAANAPMNLVKSSSTYTSAILVGPGAPELGGQASAPVGPDDVLEVPLRTTAVRGAPVVSGAVQRPGTYAWVPGLGLKRLVELAGGTTRSSYRERVVVFRTDGAGTTRILRASLNDGADLALQFTDSVHVGDFAEAADSLRTVTISGAVHHPISVPWSQGLRVKDLVVLAGGFQPWADPSRIRVDERSATGKSVASRTISLDSTLGLQAQDQDLSSASLVNVPAVDGWTELSTIHIEGEVAGPGAYALMEPRERISKVVARAGGLRPDAYADGARLYRPSEGRIPMNLAHALKRKGSSDDVELRDGDSLYIPLRPATVRVEGEVQHPATTLWRKGKDWDWYVENAGGMTDSAMRKGVYVIYADGSIHTLEGGLDDPTPGSVVVVPHLEPPKRANTIEKISAFGTVVSAIATLLTAYAIYAGAGK